MALLCHRGETTAEQEAFVEENTRRKVEEGEVKAAALENELAALQHMLKLIREGKFKPDGPSDELDEKGVDSEAAESGANSGGG